MNPIEQALNWLAEYVENCAHRAVREGILQAWDHEADTRPEIACEPYVCFSLGGVFEENPQNPVVRKTLAELIWDAGSYSGHRSANRVLAVLRQSIADLEEMKIRYPEPTTRAREE